MKSVFLEMTSVQNVVSITQIAKVLPSDVQNSRPSQTNVKS